MGIFSSSNRLPGPTWTVLDIVAGRRQTHSYFTVDPWSLRRPAACNHTLDFVPNLKKRHCTILLWLLAVTSTQYMLQLLRWADRTLHAVWPRRSSPWPAGAGEAPWPSYFVSASRTRRSKKNAGDWRLAKFLHHTGFFVFSRIFQWVASCRQTLTV